MKVAVFLLVILGAVWVSAAPKKLQATKRSKWSNFDIRSMLSKKSHHQSVSRQIPADCETTVADALEPLALLLEDFLPEEAQDFVLETLPSDTETAFRCVPCIMLRHTLNTIDTVILGNPETDWTGLEVLHCFAYATKLAIEAELESRGNPEDEGTIAAVLGNLPEDCPTPGLRRADQTYKYPECTCDAAIDLALAKIEEMLEEETEPEVAAAKKDDIAEYDWKTNTRESLADLGTPHLCTAKLVITAFMASAAKLAEALPESADEDVCAASPFVPPVLCYAGFVMKEIDLLAPDVCPLLPTLPDRPGRPDRPRHMKKTTTANEGTVAKRISSLLSSLVTKQ